MDGWFRSNSERRVHVNIMLKYEEKKSEFEENLSLSDDSFVSSSDSEAIYYPTSLRQTQMNASMKLERESEEREEKRLEIWDCGSRLYDSFELVSFGHVLERHLMMIFPAIGGSKRFVGKAKVLDWSILENHDAAGTTVKRSGSISTLDELRMKKTRKMKSGISAIFRKMGSCSGRK